MYNLLFNSPLPEAATTALVAAAAQEGQVLVDAAGQAAIDRILHELPLRSGVYSVQGPDGPVQCFFVLDELGARIGLVDNSNSKKCNSFTGNGNGNGNGNDSEDEGEEANVCAVPFVHLTTGLAYSIVWPVVPIEEGGHIINQSYRKRKT